MFGNAPFGFVEETLELVCELAQLILKLDFDRRLGARLARARLGRHSTKRALPAASEKSKALPEAILTRAKQEHQSP
jgi:hypothetical protein